MFKVLAIASLLLVANPASAAAGDGERHVVMILIDGLPAYLLDDPQASLPAIRGLAKEGVAAEAGMIVSDPSITWPNQTSLVTGCHADRHGVLFNGLLERRGPGQLVKYITSSTQQELVRVPLLFDVLKHAGQTSAAINWPCTRGSTSIDDNFPDVPGPLAHTTQRLKDELARKGLIDRFKWGNDMVQDEIWTEAACHVIRDRMPRFLALHLNNVDTVHHRYGPRSAPGYAAAAANDANVGRVLGALDATGVRDRTAVFIVADHGFAAAPKALRPNAILRREGLLNAEGGRVRSGRVLAVAEGGVAMVYLTDPTSAERDRQTVIRLFLGAEGILAVLEPKDYPRYHLPQPSDNHAMGDLVLAAKEGYAFSLDSRGDELVVPNEIPTAGAHGFLSTEPKMNAIFVAAGSGIKAGTKLTTVDNIDVAPTIARLLDVSLPHAAGRVLDEILYDAKSESTPRRGQLTETRVVKQMK
jgi:predicted AlkP superfamily pyrophosphatase or phosphodiesterase